MSAEILIAGALSGALFFLVASLLTRRPRTALARGLAFAALVYVGFAAWAHTSGTWLAVELAGVAIYGGMALRGLRGSAWWLVAGWALHPVWDVALHYFGPGRAFAPESYAVACMSWDLIVAALIALGLLRAKTSVGTRALSAEFASGR